MVVVAVLSAGNVDKYVLEDVVDATEVLVGVVVDVSDKVDVAGVVIEVAVVAVVVDCVDVVVIDGTVLADSDFSAVLDVNDTATVVGEVISDNIVDVDVVVDCAVVEGIVVVSIAWELTLAVLDVVVATIVLAGDVKSSTGLELVEIVVEGLDIGSSDDSAGIVSLNSTSPVERGRVVVAVLFSISVSLSAAFQSIVVGIIIP